MTTSETTVSAGAAPSILVTLVAWLALLPASPFATIVCETALHAPPPPWLPFLNLGASAVLLGLAYVLHALKPLRRYLLAIHLLVIGYFVLLIEGTPAWRARFDHAPAWHFVFADAALELVPCLLLGLSSLGSGLSRRDVFFTRGDLRAPFRMSPGPPAGSWAWWGPLLTLFLAGPLVVQLVATVRPDVHLAQRALQGLPLALAFAVFNAAQEEYRFRAVLLGHLVPAVGPARALWMTAVLFGLAHWHGHPSGPAGVAMAGFAGLVWGKSMLDTRGFAWAWISHGFLDLVIALLLMSSA